MDSQIISIVENSASQQALNLSSRLLRSRKQSRQKLKPFVKNENSKKMIRQKCLPILIATSKIERPFKQNHVLNVLNFLPINENALLNPQNQQSFVLSKFYHKKIKKVVIKNHDLLLSLQNLQQNVEPINIICQRLKNLGNTACNEVAIVLQSIEDTLTQVQESLYNDPMFVGKSLQDHLKQMKGKSFFSQFTPQMLIISGPLLQLLGFDLQQFAIESIKHQCIFYQFFSSQNYAKVLYKRLQNFNLINDHLKGKLSLTQCIKLGKMVYADYLYDRFNNLIKCECESGLSKQLTPYIQIINYEKSDKRTRKINSQQEKIKTEQIKQYKSKIRNQQFDTLRHLMQLPKHENPSYYDSICGYRQITLAKDKQTK